MKFLKLSICFLALLLLMPNASIGASTDIATKTKGKILLQVEDRGQAWYVLPEEKTRVYLGRPQDAFSVMQKYGLGVNNSDFDSFNRSTRNASRVKGKILIKVEDSGKAYYVNPANSKLLYLGTPSDAFLLMRTVGLGITNANLEKIPTQGFENNYGDDEPIIDSDGDNIGDDDEESLGTDPLDPDSDGDGYDDYTEITSGFNPNGDGTIPSNIDPTFVNQIKSRYLASNNITDEESAQLAELLGEKNLQGTFDNFPVYSGSYGISAKEQHLADLINEYRETKGLSRLPISKKLSFTAKVHLMDLEKNKPQQVKGCDPHSWSANDSWTEVCHNKKNKESAQGILSKGRELTEYEGISVENLYTISLDYAATPERALKGWKKSKMHNIVIINQGWAKNYEWEALGVAFYGNYVAMWVGDAEDPETINNYSDCSTENHEYIKNECAYDNASYMFDNSYCGESSDDAHQADCEIRTMLYECAGMTNKTARKKCLLDSLTIDKRACNYVYNGAKYIAKCYYKNDYDNTANTFKLSLTKGKNDISFNNEIPYTIEEFANLHNKIKEINTIYNGETLVYKKVDPDNENNLDSTQRFFPYQGYQIKTDNNIKIEFNKEPGSLKQDLGTQIREGVNFVGFQNNITSFRDQLDGMCNDLKITMTKGRRTYKKYPKSVPQANKAYLITCENSTQDNDTDNCSDTDNGIDYNTQGTISGLNSQNVAVTKTDTCENGNFANGGVLGHYVKEFYCDDNTVTSQLQLCQNGCYEGKCLEPANITCEDSDGGKNASVYGSATKTKTCAYGTSFVDCLRGTTRLEDTCNQGDITDLAEGKQYVNEYYCNGNNIVNEIIVCDGACVNGACTTGTDTQTNNYGEICDSASACTANYECKDSGRYPAGVDPLGTYTERYCCLPTECASVIPGGPGSDDDQPHCVADGGTDQFDGPSGSITKTCDNGVWYDIPSTNVYHSLRITRSNDYIGGRLTINSNSYNTTNYTAGVSNYSANDLVTLTATPENGYTFYGWTGDCQSINGNVCTVLMDEDKEVYINFRPSNENCIDYNGSCIKQINTAEADTSNFAVSDNYVVWSDKRNNQRNIYLYDLNNNTEKQLTNNSTSQEMPDIDGNYIVWEEKADIILYDIAKSQTIEINTDDYTTNQTNPAISGNYIVWQDDRNGNSDITLYNLLSKEEIIITTGDKDQKSPAIDGQRVVYKDYSQSIVYPDVYLYDIVTGETEQITNRDSYDKIDVSVSGNYITWKDNRGDISLYNITTKNENVIAGDNTLFVYPSISNDQIMWIDVSSNYYVQKYNIVSGSTHTIYSSSNSLYRTDISGENMIWMERATDGKYKILFYSE